MYKIIGADQKEYGPSSAEEIRQWVADGRANGQTLVQIEGRREWKPLASLPEFANLSYRTPLISSVPGAPSSSQVPFSAQAYAASVLSAKQSLPIGDCMNQGWRLLMDNFGLLFFATVLVCFILLILSLLPVVGVLSLLFKGVFYGGLYLVFLKRLRGQPSSVREAFSGFGGNFSQLLLVGFISLLLTVIGFMFCILPGIYLMVAWIFAIPLVADRQLGFWDAMELSRKVATRHWFQIAILLFLCFLPVILLTVYSNIVTAQFISSLIDSGQFDLSLILKNPAEFSVQMTKVSQMLVDKFLYLGMLQQFLMLLMQPFSKAVLMHAYEVLFNPRPAPTA